MRITLLQLRAAWRDAAESIRRAEGLMAAQPAADLYVLPEMWATGFDAAPTAAALDDNRAALAWMQATAAARGAALCGSLAVREEGALYNRFVLCLPSGEVLHYDKRHLFLPGREAQNYTPGAQRRVLSLGAWRVLPQVCYDLRFPVFSRCRGDYDLALYVAAWPASRAAAWHTLLRARAIENQCYVCGVNRAGSDPHMGTYAGGSLLISPAGETLCALSPTGDEEVGGATIDLAAVAQARQQFPALRSGDDFTLT